MTPAVQHNATDATPNTNENLSPTQAKVVAALAQGRTISAAARDAGIDRGTIHRWLRDQPAFKSAVQSARREYTGLLNDQLRELASTALDTLRTLLENPDTASSVRLKTALAILERPELAWRLPDPNESPR